MADGWEISNVIGQQNLNYKKSLWSQKNLILNLWILHFHMQIIDILP